MEDFSPTSQESMNNRKWNHEEDAKLVETLLEMVDLGKFKANHNGFKPGYLNYVEEKLQVLLPDSGLKAKPHIESRIKTLKRDFIDVYDMLNRPNTGGFGMDPIKKCVTTEKHTRPPAYATWRNEPFPFYEELHLIFGRDMATGANARGPSDMMDEIQKESDANNVADLSLDNYDSYISLLQSSSSSERLNVQKKRKKSAGNSTLAAEMKEAASILGAEIEKASHVLGKAIGVDAQISKKRQQLDLEIRKIPGLTVGEIIKTICHIASRDELIDVFFSMTDESKEQLVQAILNGEV